MFRNKSKQSKQSKPTEVTADVEVIADEVIVEITVEAPALKVRVLKGPLPFAEGGHTLVTYPAGRRVDDLSDETQNWLTKNDLDKDGERGVFTKLVEG